MTDNPNYTPVDWGSQPGGEVKGIGNDGLTDEERTAGETPFFEPPVIVDSGKPNRPLYSDEVYHGDKLCVAPLGEYCDDPVHGTNLDFVKDAMSAIKDSGISAADLDFYDVPEPKIPTAAELEGAAVIVDGEVVGRIGKVEPAETFDGSRFQIMDRREDPNEIVSTLNNGGYLISLGDTVEHLAVEGHGVVEKIGPVTIAGVNVPNGVTVRWPSPAGIEKNDIVSVHHADNLKTVSKCICAVDDCLGDPGRTDECKLCLALDPEAPCPKDDGGE